MKGLLVRLLVSMAIAAILFAFGIWREKATFNVYSVLCWLIASVPVLE